MTDLEELNNFLRTLADHPAGIRRKLVVLRRFVEAKTVRKRVGEPDEPNSVTGFAPHSMSGKALPGPTITERNQPSTSSPDTSTQ